MCNVRTSPFVAIVISVGLLTSVACADTLILKNGATFEGRVIKQDAKQVVFQTDNGVITFQARQVRDIRAKPWSPAVTLKTKSERSPKAKAKPRRGQLLELRMKSGSSKAKRKKARPKPRPRARTVRR